MTLPDNVREMLRAHEADKLVPMGSPHFVGAVSDGIYASATQPTHKNVRFDAHTLEFYGKPASPADTCAYGMNLYALDSELVDAWRRGEAPADTFEVIEAPWNAYDKERPPNLAETCACGCHTYVFMSVDYVSAFDPTIPTRCAQCGSDVPPKYKWAHVGVRWLRLSPYVGTRYLTHRLGYSFDWYNKEGETE